MEEEQRFHCNLDLGEKTELETEDRERERGDLTVPSHRESSTLSAAVSPSSHQLTTDTGR